MRVLLIYYTGTYNTRYLTHQVKERFCSLGWDVDAVEIYGGHTSGLHRWICADWIYLSDLRLQYASSF